MHDTARLLDPDSWLTQPQASVGRRDGMAVSQAQFALRIQAWRTCLARQNGQHFALYLTDSIEFAAALFGAWQADKTIFLSADVLPATCTALALQVDGFLGEFDAHYAPLQPSAADLEQARNNRPFKTLAPDQPGLVVFTSGSSGLAQAIPKKLSQMAREVETLEQVFGSRIGRARIIATVSHQHIYGLLFKVLWPLLAGREMAALSLAFPEQLLPLLGESDCVLVSSPAHLKRLPEHADWSQARARLRGVFSSGGPLAWEVARDNARLLGHTPCEIYGSSETGGIAWRQRAAAADEAWAALPGVRWRLAEPEGVLEVQSAHLPDEAWFRMADRAGMQADGSFVLHGRSDRIVKIEEKRISLDALERLLAVSPLVDQVRVLLPEGARQRTAAFLVLSTEGRAVFAQDGKAACNRQLRALLASAVEPVALPRSWRYLDAMPQDAQGKTTHAALQALLSPAPLLPEFQLLEQSPSRCLYQLSAPRALTYFDGHFAGTPILPGVAQLEWAVHFSRQCFALAGEFSGMTALKFQRIITPEMPFAMELNFNALKSCVDFRCSSDGLPHSSGRLLFGGALV